MMKTLFAWAGAQVRLRLSEWQMRRAARRFRDRTGVDVLAAEAAQQRAYDRALLVDPDDLEAAKRAGLEALAAAVKPKGKDKKAL